MEYSNENFQTWCCVSKNIPIESDHASEILSQVKLTHKSYTPPPEFKNEAWSSNSRCHSLEAYRGDRSRWLQEVELDVSLITMPWAFKTRTWKVISCSSSSAPQLLKLWSCSQIQKSANWEKSYFLMGLDGGIKLVDYFETEFRRVENCVLFYILLECCTLHWCSKRRISLRILLPWG